MSKNEMRRSRSDSVTAAVQAAQNAAHAPLLPPDHVSLPVDATPFWDALMRNRPRHRWNDADLATAAMLARAQYDVDRLLQEIAVEGDVIGDKLNPKHPLVDKLARRVVTLSRLLHVHPEATQGRARDQGNELDVERDAEEQHDPLIPTLRVVA